MAFEIHQGDVQARLRELPDDAFAGALCDPPYGLNFVGLKWDAEVPSSDVWRDLLRVMKPGAFLMAFGGSRTYHRLTCSIEDAGFEIRDSLCWLYGQGFPKSKSCLKPAWEPIVLARKRGPVLPLAIDESRIGTEGGTVSTGKRLGSAKPAFSVFHESLHAVASHTVDGLGRWPANVLLDDEAASDLNDQAGGNVSRFFYCAKASKAERDGNRHPTVKPVRLTEHLAGLIRPPDGGDLIIPFSGSGSEMVGAKRAGWKRVVGIEMDPVHIETARKRLNSESQKDKAN